jgi:hypothetical protein
MGPSLDENGVFKRSQDEFGVAGVREFLLQHGLEHKFSRAVITLSEFQRACETSGAIWPPNGAHLQSVGPQV